MPSKKDILEKQFDELENRLKKLNEYKEQFRNYYTKAKSKIFGAKNSFIDGAFFLDRALLVLRKYLENGTVPVYREKVEDLINRLEKVKSLVKEIEKVFPDREEIIDVFAEVIYEQVVRKALILNDQANKRFDNRFNSPIWEEFMTKFEHLVLSETHKEV
jgi:DNA repair exonuclease SbcCD ATPase subunit